MRQVAGTILSLRCHSEERSDEGISLWGKEIALQAGGIRNESRQIFELSRNKMRKKFSQKMKIKNTTLLLLFLGAFLAGCGGKKSAQPVASTAVKRAEVPDQEAWNSTAMATNRGRLTAKVKYAHMSRYSDRELMKFDGGIEVFLYDKKGRVTSTVKADRGILNEKTNLVQAFGHVVAHSDSENATLYTDHLTFDRQKEKLFTDAYVTLTTARDTLHGTGFESDQGLHHWVILKPTGVSRRPVNLNVERHFEAKRGQNRVKEDSNTTGEK